MSVTVPAGEANKDLFAIQSRITAAQAVPSTSPAYNQAQALALQTSKELVLGLLDRNAISGGAAAVLAQVSYRGTVPALVAYNALAAQIAAWNTAGTNAQLATSKSRDLDSLARQAVTELLNTSGMAPGAVLAAFSFTGKN